jgi:hypothetical protein
MFLFGIPWRAFASAFFLKLSRNMKIQVAIETLAVNNMGLVKPLKILR